MDEKQIVALFTLPLNLMAGAEVVERIRYLLQEQDPTAHYIAEPINGVDGEVPDGFEGFRIVRYGFVQRPNPGDRRADSDRGSSGC